MAVRIPGSTYRLQFNPGFTFGDARALVDYLDALGVTDLYASPILQARAGSQHGYDVVDPERINVELGGEAGFQALCAALQERQMGLLLDIVPNHMCVAGGENRLWNDVLENGRSSPSARCFDIDWAPPKADLVDKVLLPILGDQYGVVLEAQELQVEFSGGAFRLRYYEHLLPLSPRSCIPILEATLRKLEPHLDAPLLESVLTALRYLPARTETEPERLRERAREKEVIKQRLLALVEASPATAEALQAALEELNGRKGDPASFDRLDALLNDQAYRLAFWRVAGDEVNYRRFFDINELASIRVEDPEVFDLTHATLRRLVQRGQVTGLRVDHVDGLYDPGGYLRALQELARAASGKGQPGEAAIYVVVEKILAEGEQLPAAWPVHGTTGYEFLNLVGGVFVAPEGVARLHALYRRFTGVTLPFERIEYECRRLILRHAMESQVAMLSRRLDRLSELDRRSRDFTLQSLQEALVEIVAHFPVYRTYVTPDGALSADDRAAVEHAVTEAITDNASTSRSVFDFVRAVLLGEGPPGLSAERVAERREFVLKLQQLTGAITAKAVEDTAFYRFYALASRGEVGGKPSQPGVSVEAFHAANQARLAVAPHSLLTLSTHDTKRSADVRARIRVLSELPDAWEQALQRFRAANARHKVKVDGREAPDANEEYLLYQTLLGAWPQGGADPTFVARIKAYLQKALREAKLNSSWVSPRPDWEGAVDTFVERVLQDGPENTFLPDFLEFQRPVAEAARLSALCQLALTLTAPGVPDLYQGNELWDLSLVDPDNRRPVDYALRRERLAGLEVPQAALAALVKELLASPEDGRLKLLLTSRALRLRRSKRAVFDAGDYLPLTAEGPRAAQVVGFVRRHGEAAVVTLASRHHLGLPTGGAPWARTRARLPAGAPQGRYRDLLTGREHDATSGAFELEQVFSLLPLALLERLT